MGFLKNGAVRDLGQSISFRFLALCMAAVMLLAGCSISTSQLPDPASPAPIAAVDSATDPCHAPNPDCRKAPHCNPALAASRIPVAGAHASERPLSVQSFSAGFAHQPASPPPLSAST